MESLLQRFESSVDPLDTTTQWCIILVSSAVFILSEHIIVAFCGLLHTPVPTKAPKPSKTDVNNEQTGDTGAVLDSPHDLAELLICFIVHLWATIYLGWIYLSPPENLAINPMYGYSPSVQCRIAVMVGLEVWMSYHEIFCKDKMLLSMVIHHILSALVAYLGLYPFLHGYGCFYFGVADVSSVILEIYYFFVYWPHLRKQFPYLCEALKVLFAVVFISVRLIWWGIVTVPWWQAMVALLINGYTTDNSGQIWKCHSYFAVVAQLVANTFLTGLQLLWGGKIIQGMIRILTGDTDRSKDKIG